MVTGRLGTSYIPDLEDDETTCLSQVELVKLQRDDSDGKLAVIPEAYEPPLPVSTWWELVLGEKVWTYKICGRSGIWRLVNEDTKEETLFNSCAEALRDLSERRDARFRGILL